MTTMHLYNIKLYAGESLKSEGKERKEKSYIKVRGNFRGTKMKCETTNIFRYKIMIYPAGFSHCEDCSVHCPLIGVMSVLNKD